MSSKLAVIVASTREGRFADTVVRWFMEQVGQRVDFDVQLIDLRDLKLHPVLDVEDPQRDRLLEWIGAADAFVVVTPEYNHGYPAALKHAIDCVYEEWRAKPVAFVSYGGMAGGLRAVEQLRQVFAEMHAPTMRDAVSFHSCYEQFDDDGRPINSEQVNGAAKVMLDQLEWWATALRNARVARPYAA
ncbi:NAD(P)H-dependent oxidoreductase [Micromonospora sp. NPDC047707]|uniref:NADPH-dependent FMN reductase n=1 Tax=Micromonospora sp. NPDC047707 TaxID=3154498 RepID=UPI0034514A48